MRTTWKCILASTEHFLSPVQSVGLISCVQDCFRNRNESRKRPQTCFVSEKCQKAEKNLLVGRQNSVRKVHDDASQIRKVLPEDGRKEVLEQGTLALVFNTAGMEWVPVLYLRRESCGHHRTHSKTKTNPANRRPLPQPRWTSWL